MTRPQKINCTTIPYEASVAELLRYIDTRSKERWVAFIALGHHSEPQAIHHLIRYTESSDPHNRRAAAEAIQYCKDITPAVPYLLKCLCDTDDNVVSAACATLAHHGDRENHNEIISLLKHSSPSVRVASLYALRNLWEESDFAIVLDLFKNDRLPQVWKEAAWLLFHRADLTNWAVLFREFRSNSYHHCRGWACKLVETFGDKSNQNDLPGLLNDKDGHVRKAAEKALSIISLK